MYLNEITVSSTQELELGLVGVYTTPVRTGGTNLVSMQACNTTGAWGTGVLTLQRSNDGQNWFAFPSAVTLSADGIAQADNETLWVRAIVTTAGTSGHRVKVSIYASIV